MPLAAALLVASMPTRAYAGKCYVDSDCPTGMVCNAAGGCETPTSSGSGSSQGGGMSPLGLVLGLVLVVGILVVVSYKADQSYDQYTLLPPVERCQEQPAGLVIRF